MMALQFNPMPQMFDDQLIWGAIKGDFTFVITKDTTENRYTATAKNLGARAFDGSRIDLGGFNAHHSMQSAVQACEDFYKKSNN